MPAGKPMVSERTVPPSRRGQTIPETFTLYPGDRRLLIGIMSYYGCSKSEAFRTIVRAHAAQVGVR